jgi:alpha-galactosidase
LLSNDEVLAVDQDELGIQAIRMATVGPVDVYLKKLADGSRAVGFFNRGNSEYSGTFDKLHRIGIREKQHARDLWRQKDLPDVTKNVPLTIPAHGVLLYKFTPAK